MLTLFRIFGLVLILPFFAYGVTPNEIVALNEREGEYPLKKSHLHYFEDLSGRISFDALRNLPDSVFKASETFNVQTKNVNAVYWIRFTYINNCSSDRNWIIEFLDFRIDDIEVFVPYDGQGYKSYHQGDVFSFGRKLFPHKNHIFPLPNTFGKEITVYGRIKNIQHKPVGLSCSIRSYENFVGYAVREYLFLALFYGMVFIMAIYNFLLFLGTKEKSHFFYSIYVSSIALFSLSHIDGLGLQFLWPNYPELNEIVSITSLAIFICGALLFAQSFLNTKTNFPLISRIISILIISRILIGAGNLMNEISWTKLFDVGCLTFAVFVGILSLIKGYKTSKYYLIAIFTVFLGFFTYTIQDFGWVDTNIFVYYSLNAGMMADVILLSMAIASKTRGYLEKIQKSQDQAIKALEENAKLKDSINKELEIKVAERTSELESTMNEVNYQATLLKEQNELLTEQKLELVAISDDLTNQSNELKSINTVLQRSNKTKDKLFSIIGHDLKNPIGNIKAITEIALKELGNASVEEVKKHISMAQHTAAKTKEMLENLLHWAISQTESIQFKPQKIIVKDLIENVLSEQRNLLAQKGIESKVDISSSHEIFADKDLVLIILRNILTNAIKFTPKGGVVDVKVFDKNEFVGISIGDNGVGIENVDKLLKNDSYKTSEGTEGEESTGLGYNLIRDFITINQGKLDIKSKIGEGTTVFVYFPKQSNDHQEVAIPATLIDKKQSIKRVDSSGEIKNKSILLIDDDEVFLESLRFLFLPDNKVFMAQSAETGFLMAQKETPDIILSDLNMPGLDGFELSKKLKDDSALRHIPLLLLTANDEKDIKNQAFELGFEDFIPKPIDNEFLLAKMKSIFKNREMLKNHLNVHLLSKEKIKSFKNKDEEFVHQAIELIKKHIEEPYLSVEFIAGELGVSRAQLFRKMKELAGESPNDFIKMIRMQLAKGYFDNGETHIAEVAYKVGFSDPQYFSTCYLKAFGISPRNYTKQQKEP